MSLKRYLEALRPFNWVKNIIILIPFILSLQLPGFNVFLAFIIVCLFSSAGYIFNGIIDADEDRLDPNKRNRPFASKSISALTGELMIYFLMGIGIILISLCSYLIGILVSIMLIIDIIYSLYFRNILMFDVITLALKYPIRLIIGYILIDQVPNTWLISTLFFMAIWLALLKRHGELSLSGRSVWNNYKSELNILATLFLYFTFIFGNIFSVVYVSIFSFIPMILFYMIGINYYDTAGYKESKSLAILKDKRIIAVCILYMIIFVVSKWFF